MLQQKYKKNIATLLNKVSSANSAQYQKVNVLFVKIYSLFLTVCALYIYIYIELSVKT